MSTTADEGISRPVAQTREFWVLVAHPFALELLGVFAALVFLGMIGHGARWYSDSNSGWFGGHWWWLAVTVAVGLGLFAALTVTRLVALIQAILVIAKMLTIAISLGSGFVGGPVFPSLFIGGTAGVFVHQVTPGIPLGLAVTCLLAAVPGALVSAPFAMVLAAAFLTQIGALQSAPHPHLRGCRLPDHGERHVRARQAQGDYGRCDGMSLRTHRTAGDRRSWHRPEFGHSLVRSMTDV